MSQSSFRSHFVLLEEVDSTQDEVLSRLETFDFSWVQAKKQKKGRGRQQRPWVDASSESSQQNLFLSVACLLRPEHKLHSWPQVTLIAGLSLWKTLQKLDLVTEGSFLKWPNDLYWKGDSHFFKVGGILSEKKSSALVVGWGVNLFEAPTIENAPTKSLLQLGGNPEKLESLSQILRETFEKDFSAWLHDPAIVFQNCIQALNQNAMQPLWGQTGWVPSLQQKAAAIALSATGNLLVKLETNQETKELSSGEWLFQP